MWEPARTGFNRPTTSTPRCRAGRLNSRRPVKSIAVPPNGVVVGPLAASRTRRAIPTRATTACRLRVEKKLTHGLSLSGSYVFSKTISDGEGGASIGTTSAGPQDPRNFRAERALADEDFKHRFVASYVYDLPFGRGRVLTQRIRSAGPVRRRLDDGGHRDHVERLCASIWACRAILPTRGGHDRPNVLHDWYLDAAQRSVSRWFDTTAFARQCPVYVRQCGPQPDRRSAVAQLRSGALQDVSIVERARLQFRAEAFNATNTPYFGSPNATVGTPAFGQISSANTPRNMQFGLKVLF